jgi:hypothetical protein
MSMMVELACTVHIAGAMHDATSGVIDVVLDDEAGSCWCGGPTDDGDAAALGLRFCTSCRARMLRSGTSILAIARGRAARRVPSLR